MTGTGAVRFTHTCIERTGSRARPKRRLDIYYLTLQVNRQKHALMDTNQSTVEAVCVQTLENGFCGIRRRRWEYGQSREDAGLELHQLGYAGLSGS